MIAPDEHLTITDLRACFTGMVPAVLVTASRDGVPNVTYLSRVHPVDAERVALSNQFFSKSQRNLAENPAASLLVVHPDTAEEFRLSVEFEQTVRRGPLFDRLRRDLSMLAALTGMQDVFRLAGADIYRVMAIERVIVNERWSDQPLVPSEASDPEHAALGELCARMSRCNDLDTLVRVVVEGLADLLDYDHSILMLVDESGERLFTIAAHGYAEEGVGSEVAVGEGVVGLAAQQCAPICAQNLAQMTKYARSVRSSAQRAGASSGGHEVPLPGLAVPGSQMAAPALTLGELVGVLLVESPTAARFSERDLASLSIVATLTASLIDKLRSAVGSSAAAPGGAATAGAHASGATIAIRHFPADGSTFVGTEYLIKGVAGKLLWSLLRHYQEDGRTDFTNREMRLDSSLDLPDFRDNFESRLILLKRRLDEREIPVRIHKSGRGRFRLEVAGTLSLEEIG